MGVWFSRDRLSKPWQRIHIDFAGPMKGKMYLVTVDVHSKWPDVKELNGTSATTTIQALWSLFASFGLPEQVVSDNGPPFNSQDFTNFMKDNGIKHIRSTPYQPSTNGLVERFIQTFKRAFRTSESSGKPVHHRIANFLLSYRNTPHTTTNRFPSELFLKRELKTHMDLLRPDNLVKVTAKQAEQKQHHDNHSMQRLYRVGDNVMALNFHRRPKWLLGVIAEVKGPLSYIIQLKSGVIWWRHVNQVCNGVSDEIPLGTTAETELSTPDVTTGVEILALQKGH